MTIKEYYKICGFDGNLKSYEFVGNCSSILKQYLDVIESVKNRELAHNYLNEQVYKQAVSQTKNMVYANTLTLWKSVGYNSHNIGYLGEYFTNTNPEISPLFNSLANKLNITNPQGKITVQPPGSSFPFHIDAFLENYCKNYNVEPQFVKRYCIFLSEWQIGQFFGIGNSCVNFWNFGDIITWDNLMPHATSNASLTNKISINITGTIFKIS